MFNILNLKINRGTAGSNEPGHDTTVIHTYIDLTSTIATIKLYFPPNLGQGVDNDMVFINDYMFIAGSDGAILAPISSLVPFLVGGDLFTGGTAITMGAPIPPVDGNGARVLAGILQMEFASQTQPGIMSAAPQDFGGHKTFHADITILDPVSGLIIDKTMGPFGITLITNDPNATVSIGMEDTALPGEFFGMIYKRTGFLGATPELYILGGNQAGIIFNDTAGTVTIGDNTITNVLDSRVGQPLSIGGTNATVINLGTNTTLPFDKELFTNTINGVTAVPLIIGATNSTAIHLEQDVTINATKTLFTNEIDALSAVPLEIGATNATVISLLENVSIADGKQLHTNYIDSITAAPLIVGDTNTTFVVMNKGVQFLTSGGTPATLNDYEEFVHNTTFTNNTETTAAVGVVLVKVGHSIILRIPADFSVPGQVAPAAFFAADTVLPARFRPAQNCNGPFRVESNGGFQEGWFEVTSAGNINIYANVNFASSYTPAFTSGFSAGTFAYSN